MRALHRPCVGGAVTGQLNDNEWSQKLHRPCVGGAVTGQLNDNEWTQKPPPTLRRWSCDWAAKRQPVDSEPPLNEQRLSSRRIKCLSSADSYGAGPSGVKHMTRPHGW
jgi:hypothetical protein